MRSLLNFGFQRSKRKIDNADEECDDNHAPKKQLKPDDHQFVNVVAGKCNFMCVLSQVIAHFFTLLCCTEIRKSPFT